MNTIQFVMMIVNWVSADPSHVVVVASAIAALTPTPDPATNAGKLYRMLDLLALNFLHAKSTGVSVNDVATQVAAILEKKAVPQQPVA